MSIHATSTEVYSGKNILNVSSPFTVTNSTVYSSIPVSISNGTTVCVQCDSITTNSTTGCSVRFQDSNLVGVGTVILYPGTTLSQSVTLSGDAAYCYVYSSNNYANSQSATTTYTNLMVSKGSTAQPYEPYVGGVPSPLISDVAHVSTSKNLLNMQSNSNGEYLGTASQKTYSGKNLFNSYVAPNYTLSDGTITVDSDGIISMSGNTRNNGYCRIYTSFSDFAPSLVAGQTYYIYVNNEFAQGNRNYIYLYGSSFFWNSGQPHTVTQAELDANIVLYGGYQATTKITVMITTASDSNYEPYVGGIPSPNPDYPQEIVTGKLASKNIFEAPSSPAEVWQGDYTKITANSLKVKSTANHPTSTAYARVDITGLAPNTDYYFSYNYERTGGTVSGPTVGGVATGIDGGSISSVTVGGRKINTGPGTYIRFYFYVGQNTSITTSDEVTFSDIQLEQGSTATVFEPYFTPIELAQIGDYQDRVYKSGDNWYVQKNTNNLNVKDYKDKPWYISQYQGNSYVVKCLKTDLGISDMLFDAGSQSPTSDICNYFTAEPTIQLYQGAILVGFGITTDGIYFSNNSWSINDFKNFVDNHDVLIYYRKNTPTNTAITDPTTIAWLNKYDTDSLPHHKYINTRRTTYIGASGLASAIDLYDGSYASALPTYSTANDHHLTTANGGTYTVSLQNISTKIVSGTVTFSVFTNQRKIDFSWNGSATSTNVSVSLQADEYIKSIYAYIPQDADAGITLSQQLESGSLTNFEPYYNIVKIYAGDDLVFEDTSLTD